MTMHTLAAHEPTRAEALAASGEPTPPTTNTGPLATPRRVVGPELAAVQQQLAEMGERVSHLAEDVAIDADMTSASLTDLRGAVRAMAAAELKVRQAASLMGAVVTLDAAAPAPAPKSAGRPRRKGGRSAASAALEDTADATGSDPDAEADADATFGRGWRSE